MNTVFLYRDNGTILPICTAEAVEIILNGLRIEYGFKSDELVGVRERLQVLFVDNISCAYTYPEDMDGFINGTI